MYVFWPAKKYFFVGFFMYALSRQIFQILPGIEKTSFGIRFPKGNRPFVLSFIALQICR